MIILYYMMMLIYMIRIQSNSVSEKRGDQSDSTLSYLLPW